MKSLKALIIKGLKILSLTMGNLASKKKPENFSPFAVYSKMMNVLRFLSFFLFSYSALFASSLEESLALRRIADFWQEGDFTIAKKEIEIFLESYPDSSYKDSLALSLADLSLRQGEYKKALDLYATIQAPQYAERIELQKMHCMYSLQWYASVIDTCEALQQQSSILPSALQNYLVLSLYHLFEKGTAEEKSALAAKAIPAFETFLESTPSLEFGSALAELYLAKGELSKASELYLTLGDTYIEKKEELLFRAALIETKQNKERAVTLFEAIEQSGCPQRSEASYNRLVLLFELKRFEEILSLKDTFAQHLPLTKTHLLPLFLGKAALGAHQYGVAVKELSLFLDAFGSSQEAPLAYASLAKAYFLTQNLDELQGCLTRFQTEYPTHPDLCPGMFAKALLLKQMGDIPSAELALEELLNTFPSFSFRPQVLFESAHLAYQTKRYDLCLKYSFALLEGFPSHELSPFALGYFGNSVLHIAKQPPFEKNTLSQQFSCLKARADALEGPAKADWLFTVAKAYFDTADPLSARDILAPLIENDSLFPQKANAKLLLALCLHHLSETPPGSIALLENIREERTFLDPVSQELLLFNLYLKNSQEEKAQGHLLAAFHQGASLSDGNLLWLASSLQQSQPSQAIELYEKLLAHQVTNEQTPPHFLCALARLYLNDQQPLKALSILMPWADALSSDRDERLYLLAAASFFSSKEAALQYLEQLKREYPPGQNIHSAQGCLDMAALELSVISENEWHLRNPVIVKVLSSLKGLFLLRNAEQEPLHVQALHLYLLVKERCLKEDPEQFLTLLEKTKNDLESEEDLLSKEYHALKNRLPELKSLYENQLYWIDGKICLVKSTLATKDTDQAFWREKGDALLKAFKEEKLLTLDRFNAFQFSL